MKASSPKNLYVCVRTDLYVWAHMWMKIKDNNIRFSLHFLLFSHILESVYFFSFNSIHINFLCIYRNIGEKEKKRKTHTHATQPPSPQGRSHKTMQGPVARDLNITENLCTLKILYKLQTYKVNNFEVTKSLCPLHIQAEIK